MKNFLLLTIALISLSAWAGKDRGGGDPLLIHAVEYPEIAQLNAAINLATENVRLTFPELHDTFKKETEELISKKYFLMLPSLLILSPVSLSGYGKVLDATTFYELGGFTISKSGAPIFFSERVRQYTVEKLAELFTHEIYHHILDEALDEEGFVEELAQATMARQSDKYIDRSLQSGLIIRKGYVSGQSFRKKIFFALLHARKDLMIGKYPPLIAGLDFFDELSRAENVYDLKLLDFVWKVGDETASYNRYANWNSQRGRMMTYRALANIVRDIDPNNSQLSQDKYGNYYLEVCRTYKGRFLWRKCAAQKTLGEFLVP